MSPWLQVGLRQRGLSAVCLEAFHTRSALSAMRNKTDKADARGIAHIMRTGWFKQVHVKSAESYRLRLLLTQRRNLKRNSSTSRMRSASRSRRSGSRSARSAAAPSRRGWANWWQAIHSSPGSPTACCARAALWQEYLRLHTVVIAIVRRDELCQRFRRIPGVGPISALVFKTAIDDPHRFRRSQTVGAYLGLTSRRWQFGSTIDVRGRVSKAGDGEVRHPLYEAANVMLIRYRGLHQLEGA